MKRNKGITLIALVFTIVILIILAGVAISLSLGENGIFSKAQQAKQEYVNQQEKEEQELQDMYSKMLVATDGQFTGGLTELKKLILDMSYPVGSIYISTVDTDPATTLGGEWEKYSQGRTLIGDGEYTDKNGVTKTFAVGDADAGEYNHTLTVAEMPSHTHRILSKVTGSSYSGSGWQVLYNDNANNPTNRYASSIEPAGGSQSHNNIQPYIVTYIWKRIK